jgi:hypothetical protein
VKSSPKKYPNPFFVKICAFLLPWKKVDQKVGPLQFVIFKKLPKVNNRSMGEKSPNLVTLLEIGSPTVLCTFQTDEIDLFSD